VVVPLYLSQFVRVSRTNQTEVTALPRILYVDWARGHPIQPFAKPNNVHRATLQEIIS